MKVTTKTHPRPEEAFVDADLLALYRRLNEVDEGWSRAVKAGCLEFVAAAQEDRPLPPPGSASTYRKMLRRLLELDGVAPPPGKVARRPKRRSGRSSPLVTAVAA